jgi:hypothetical protein
VFGQEELLEHEADLGRGARPAPGRPAWYVQPGIRTVPLVGRSSVNRVQRVLFPDGRASSDRFAARDGQVHPRSAGTGGAPG